MKFKINRSMIMPPTSTNFGHASKEILSQLDEVHLMAVRLGLKHYCNNVSQDNIKLNLFLNQCTSQNQHDNIIAVTLDMVDEATFIAMSGLLSLPTMESLNAIFKSNN